MSGDAGTLVPRGLLSVGMLIWSAGLSPALAAPPANQTYFIVNLGIDEPYSWEADCLRFTQTEICTSDGDCGTWSRVGPEGPESAVTFEFLDDEGGDIFRIEGQARVDDRGKQSSLAGVASIAAGGKEVNFGFTGRAVSRKKCERVVRDFRNSPQGKNPGCYERAHFGDPGASEYILPFPQGSAYEILHSYCSRSGSHGNQLAYDFLLPVGAEIIAARGGVVRELREVQPDDGRDCQDHNYVLIEHDAGSVGFYAHLMQDGVLVNEGDRVESGDPIASSGNSCTNLIPHLHFGVYGSWPPVEGEDRPVNFVNARGPLDMRGGLMVGYVYTAVSY